MRVMMLKNGNLIKEKKKNYRNTELIGYRLMRRDDFFFSVGSFFFIIIGGTKIWRMRVHVESSIARNKEILKS